MRTRLVLSSIAALAAAQLQCGPPPDDTGTEGEDWCATAAPRDLWACEAAMQRRLLGSSTPRHGCDAAAPSTTAVAVGSRDTVPHAQTWADLRWASYEGGFLLHDQRRRPAARRPGARAAAADRLLGATSGALLPRRRRRQPGRRRRRPTRRQSATSRSRAALRAQPADDAGRPPPVDVPSRCFTTRSERRRRRGPARTRISIQVHVERRSLHRRLMDRSRGHALRAAAAVHAPPDPHEGRPRRPAGPPLPAERGRAGHHGPYYPRPPPKARPNRGRGADASESGGTDDFGNSSATACGDVTRPPKRSSSSSAGASASC